MSTHLTHPKVGVGVVILRHLIDRPRPETLLIRRGKPPSLGQWSFCGGSLELGETLVDCAVREAKEETGLDLQQLPLSPPLPSLPSQNTATITPTSFFFPDLRHPAVFAAVDVIDRDPGTNNLRYHYAVVEVAARVKDPRAQPRAADDADEAQWVDVEELRSLPDVVPNAVEIVEEALVRFHQLPRE